MIIKELIELLKEQDPDLRVFLVEDALARTSKPLGHCYTGIYSSGNYNRETINNCGKCGVEGFFLWPTE